MKKIKETISKIMKDTSDGSSISYNQDKDIFYSKKKEFNKENTISNFFVNDEQSDNVTLKQKTFYEDVKFPNYDDLETYGDLIEKASQQSHLASILDKSIGFNSKVLEVGCGTGQLSLFLKRYNREICGIDISSPSLKLAENFRIRNEIDNVVFFKMNIFNMQFKDEVFDYVISNGVLHHTFNTELAFEKILKPLKVNGYVVIGLYHRYGRLYTNFKQLMIQNFGEHFKFLDKRTIDPNISEEKRYAWLKDQYKNPHETSHTLNEVKYWFKKYGVEYLTSIPFNKIDKNTNLFKESLDLGNVSLLHEMSLMFSLSQIKEGGFFIVVGKKLK